MNRKSKGIKTLLLQVRNPDYRQRQAAKNLAYKNHQLPVYLGVDGEGQGRRTHRYVLLAANNEAGDKRVWVENFSGLSTRECLDFLLSLSNWKTFVFAYSFGYDTTKILKDLPDSTLYRLLRPDTRPTQTKDSFEPEWMVWGDYALNMQGSRFSIRHNQTGQKVTIWDLFKFYQSRFVAALDDWKISTPEKRAHMSRMKDKRGEFDKVNPDDVREYCLEECRDMAELGRKLIDATNAAGLRLRSFHGAGSIATALLKREGIKDQLRPVPANMRRAVMCAFSGGRFENSVIGMIRERVFNKDISSAYPYHITFLPCLMHGVWEWTTNRRDLDASNVKGALVQYFLGTSDVTTWGPFPYRIEKGDERGSIVYPVESAGGWVYLQEFLAGERAFNHVHFMGAWVLKGECDCQPFHNIPNYYRERLRIGKEGPGIIIKLGYNAVYGKLAQSVGTATFNNWIWAGMTTSGCRAQVLDVMALHHDRANLLVIATDGIYTREDVKTPEPRDTNTAAVKAPCEKHHKHPKCPCGQETGELRDSGFYMARKPLGGWETKAIDKGVFIVRPGIYFPWDPSEEELKDVRGRGVGKGVVLENWRRIAKAWENRGPLAPAEVVAKVANVTRFCGAKSSVMRREKKNGGYIYSRADGYSPATRQLYKKARRWLRAARVAPNVVEYLDCLNHAAECREKARNQPSFGQWVTREVELGFDPLPKRLGINPDGMTLQVRKFRLEDGQSAPYDKKVIGLEKAELLAHMRETLEQPDADLSDYEHDS